MKDLAVLIAVYNDEEALLSALDSIDEPDNSFTVVIVDDGSDRSPSLAEDRYPFRTVLLKQERNTGIAGALNVGIDWIREQGFGYLARLDAGDVARKGRLAKQYARFQEREDLVLLGTNATFVDEETGEPLFETNLPQTWEQIRKWCVFRTCFIHPTVMMRLERLDESYRYGFAYPHIEDYVLFTRIAERHPSEVLAEPLVDCYRRRTGISCRKERAQLLSGIRHHLDHPKPLNPLWYAYIAKRLAYLVLPYSWRQLPKRLLGIVTHSPAGATARTQSNEAKI